MEAAFDFRFAFGFWLLVFDLVFDLVLAFNLHSPRFMRVCEKPSLTKENEGKVSVSKFKQ